jgi:nucleoside-diphosphate-sugar epimerase
LSPKNCKLAQLIHRQENALFPSLGSGVVADILSRMKASERHRVLVTGSAGRIGKAAVEALVSRGHFVRGFDRIPSDAASESTEGDIGNWETVTKAVAGMDTIIHLAATPDDDDFMTTLLPNNIVPIHHILESARIHGVQRVILASTGQVNWYHHFNGPFPVGVSVSLTPRYWYAVTKIFAEFAGKVFSETHKMDVVAVRLGACPRDRASVDFIGTSEITRDVYLSPADAGRFFVLATEAGGGFGFQVVYTCSKWVLREVLDLEPARRLFGFEPRDRWPEGVPPEIIGDKPIPGIP